MSLNHLYAVIYDWLPCYFLRNVHLSKLLAPGKFYFIRYNSQNVIALVNPMNMKRSSQIRNIFVKEGR